MNTLVMSFSGDVNLGMYCKVSEKFCLAAHFIQDRNLRKISELLKVKIVRTTLANTDLVGLFVALNSNGILLPHIVSEREISHIKSESRLNVGILKTKYTAVGNLILSNDRGAVISKIFSQKEKKTIEDVLDVETEYTTVAKLNNVGSCGIATNEGCLLHRDASEKEIDFAKNILKVNTDIGTANFGSPFVGSCMLANSHGAIVGETTTGPEIARIMETLGLI